jgi:hypothetical protein
MRNMNKRWLLMNMQSSVNFRLVCLLSDTRLFICTTAYIRRTYDGLSVILTSRCHTTLLCSFSGSISIVSWSYYAENASNPCMIRMTLMIRLTN